MIDTINRETSSLQSNRINTCIAQRRAAGFDIRRNIFSNKGTTTDKCMLADLYKLVNGTNTTKPNPVAKLNVTGKLCVIAKRTVITDITIVTDMAVSEDPAVVANNRFPTIGGTPVYSNKFANGCIVADLNKCVFTGKFS